MTEERKDSTMEVLLDDLEDEAAAAGAPEPTGAVPPPPPPPSSPGSVKAASMPPPPPPGTTKPSVPPPAPPATKTKASVPPPAPTRSTEREGAKRKSASMPPPPPSASRTPAKAAAPVMPSPPARVVGAPAAPPPAAAPPVPATRPPDPPDELDAPLSEEAIDVGDAEMRDAFSEEAIAAAQAIVAECEAELRQTEDARRQARLHFEIARLQEAPLGDLRKAVAHYREALDKAPEHLPTLRGTRRVLLARRSFQAALQLFDDEVRITPDPPRKAALIHEKGRVLEDVLGRKPDAREAYATALELDPGNPLILRSLVDRYIDEKRWGDLERTLKQAANAVSDDPRHRAALVAWRARLAEEHGQDPEKATELYETALRLDPRTGGALAALKRLHHKHRRWRDLIRVLRVEAELTEDATVATSAWFRIGQLQSQRLGNRDEAIGALERAVELASTDALILDELARLYEEAGRWDALAATLERLAHTQRDPTARLGLLHRIGDLYATRLHQPEAAMHWFASALALDATHLPTLQALAPLYRAAERWDALVQIHLGEAEHAQDSERRAAAFARVGFLMESEIGEIGAAIEHHEKALATRPGYEPSFKALARLYAQTSRHRELVDLHERASSNAPDKARQIAHLMKIGALHEGPLNDPVNAAHAYRRILEIDVGDFGAIHALQRATEAAGRHREHVDALEREVARTEEIDRKVALLHRAGEVLEEKLGDREGALQRFRKVLEMAPAYAPALESLGRLYNALGRWEDLLGIYEKELALDPRSAAAAGLLHRMGDLCEHRIGRERDALAFYRKALDVEPTHGPSLHALTRKLRANERWEDLVEVMLVQLSGLSDPMTRARLACAIGEVREERIRDARLALESYRQALDECPDHRPALDAIARLRAAEKSTAALVSDLASEAEAVKEPAAKVDAAMRRGALLADADPRKAISAFEEVLQSDPTHLGALLALEELYRRVGSWEPLARVLATQANALLDPSARVGALEARAALLRGRNLGAAQDLLDVYECILAIDPGHVPALQGLEAVALQLGDPARLVDADRRLAALADDPSVRALHTARLAESLESLGREGALEAYREALRYDPEHIGATKGLQRIAERMDDPVVLAEAARQSASVARDPHVRARLLAEGAQVRTQRLGDIEGALADLEEALEICPDSEEAAHGLTQLLHARGEPARLIDRLSRAAGAATQGHRATELWLQIADLQADQNNLGGALAALDRILRVAANHVPALRKSADLLQRDGQNAEAAKVLERLIRLAPDHDVLVRAHLDLARISKLAGQGSRALVSLQAVLTLDEHHAGALVQLADLHESEGRLDEAATAASQLLEVTREPASRAPALVRLARLERSRGNDIAAVEALREAVAIEGPGSESAIECKALCTTTAQWTQYLTSLEAHLRSLAPDEAALTYLEMARTLFDQLERPGEAIDVLQRGLELTGEPQLQRELAMRLRMAGRHAEAIEAWQTLGAADATRVDTWRELARTYLGAGLKVEARLAADILRLLGGASEREQSLLGQAPPRPLGARAGSLSPLLDKLGTPSSQQAAAGALLRSLEGALAKLYPPDLESYGLSSRDKLTTRGGHPMRQLTDEIAAVLGVESYELFVHRARTRGLGLELGSPPMLIVPAAVGDLPRAQQVFLLARPMVHIARGYAAVDKLTPRELEVLLASAARNVRQGYGAGLTSEEFLDEQAKRLYKALGRRYRKPMEEAGRAYVDAGRVDFARWVHGARRTAHRVAGLLSDDLVAAVDVLRRTERDLGAMEGPALVRSSEVVADLVAFWASKAAMHIRRHAGMLPDPNAAPA